MSDSLFRLDSRVAVVVGAGSGIGEPAAGILPQAGAHVACLDLDLAKADAVARRITGSGGSADSASCDIRDGDARTSRFDAIRARQGRLDIAVCTPSINVRKTLLKYSEEEF